LKLAELKVYPEKFAQEISKSVGTRNILIHEYNNVDYDKIYSSISDCLKDYHRYCGYILKFLENNMDLNEIKEIIKKDNGKFIIVEDGEPTMVILSFGDYQKILGLRGESSLASASAKAMAGEEVTEDRGRFVSIGETIQESKGNFISEPLHGESIKDPVEVELDEASVSSRQGRGEKKDESGIPPELEEVPSELLDEDEDEEDEGPLKIEDLPF